MTTASYGQQQRPRQRRPNGATRIHRHSAVRYQAGGPSEVNCFVKYAIFFFNIIFFFVGIALVGVGTFCQVDKTNIYSRFQQIHTIHFDPTIIMIVIGIFTFFIGFCGCIGSLRENTTLLTIYSTLLGIILLLEAAIFVFACIYKDKASTMFKDALNEVIVRYRDDEDLQTFIDMAQTQMECCGIESPADWDRNIYFASESSQVSSPEAAGVPFSCCKPSFRQDKDGPLNFACGHKTRLVPNDFKTTIFDKGCLIAAEEFVRSHVLGFGITVLVVAVIQMLGVSFAQNLKSDILAQKAKWMNS